MDGYILPLNSRENFTPPACQSREDARPQIPGRVDSVAAVEAHRQADDEHRQSHGERLQASGDRVVVRAGGGQDAKDQRGRPDHLQQQLGEAGKTFPSDIFFFFKLTLIW